MEEKHGTSPLLAAIEDVKRLNEVEESLRVAACAAFISVREER